MRVVEAKMCKAIENQTKMRVGNTEVRIDEPGNTFEVRLHGHKIIWGTLNGRTTEYMLSSGGWHSNTTKSRLNAFLQDFVPGHRLFQKKHEWYISSFRVRTPVPFSDGMTVPVKLFEFPKIFQDLEKYF